MNQRQFKSPTFPTLIKVGGPALPKQYSSKEAQELMSSLNRIKSIVREQNHQHIMQSISPLNTPPNSAQKSNQSTQSQQKYDNSPFKELQGVCLEDEIQFQDLPAPNLNKVQQYQPQSPIIEQVEEEVESPTYKKHKVISRFVMKEFCYDSKFKKQAEKKSKVSVNLYRTQPLESSFDIEQQQIDIKQLQLTLNRRIDSLNQVIYNSSKLGTTRNKENTDLLNQRLKEINVERDQSATQRSAYKNLLQWTGVPNQSVVKQYRSNDTTPKKKTHHSNKTNKSICVVTVDLKEQRRRAPAKSFRKY